MAAHMYDQSVELRASTCVRIISLCASERVPLIDTLDNTRHQGVLLRASKLISEHMGRSMQTMHLSCIKISTISK